MVGALALLVQSSEPSAFRAIFEDRPRQLIVRVHEFSPSEGLYLVFSPDVCAIRKVWRGTVNFRGKVYDFSQDNSFGEGKSLYEVPSEVLTAGDFATTSSSGNDPTWKFSKPNDQVGSKAFAVKEWGPLYFAFDEKGDTDSLRISFLKNGGQVAYEYVSSNTIMGSGFWQFNYKLIPFPKEGFEGSVRVSAPTLAKPKELRRPRLFGDRLAWFDSNGPVSVRFRGYRTSKGRTVIEFEAGGRTVELFAEWRNDQLHLNYSAKSPGQPLTLKTYQSAFPEVQLAGAAR